MNGTSSNTSFFSFGPDDSFISKSYEGLRYRNLPTSLHDLIIGGSVLDVHWASLGPVSESWVLSFKDASGKSNLGWGPSIPPRLQTLLSKLSPSLHFRVFLGPNESYIAWDPTFVRWSNLPPSLEDSLQSWLTPAGWKAGPPRMVTWGAHDAFFAMSEYGDVAYRLGAKEEDEWITWKETVEEWKGEEGFVWSELAYISLDPTTQDQFVAIRNDGTWAGAIDDTNEDALEAFARNFFCLAKSRSKGRGQPKTKPQTNGYHHRQNHQNNHQHHQTNGSPKRADTTPDAATQAFYEQWSISTAALFASALAATNPQKRAPKKLQIRSQSSQTSPTPAIPTSSASIPQGALLTSFPYLPSSIATCTKPACLAHKSDPKGLRACRHDVELLLRASGLYSYEWLRQERIRWHPDRFGRLCAESWREDGKRMAEEMFKIIDALIGEF